jgi:Bifunctional DNA primase/polymerase, N-terminal
LGLLDYMTLTAEQNRINESADFWRYQIGVNVIPADTKNKVPSIRWSQWQDKLIPEKIHNTWKQSGDFSNGLAIIPGKIWHKKDKNDLYFIFVDVDKNEGIEEICTRNGRTISLEKMSEKFLVEQHKDNPDKAHIYFYSPIPFVQKAADSIIGLEVKGVGHDGISFCSPSIHKNGHPYEIIGTTDPAILSPMQARELMQHIDQICIKHGLQYLEKGNGIDSRLKNIIKGLVIDPKIRIHQSTRHITLISVADSLLFNHLGRRKKTAEQLKDFFWQINSVLCDPEPLPEKEVNSIWTSALDFVSRTKGKTNEENVGGGDGPKQDTNRSDRGNPSDDSVDWLSITQQLLEKYRFKTMSDTEEIYYYNTEKMYTRMAERPWSKYNLKKFYKRLLQAK